MHSILHTSSEDIKALQSALPPAPPPYPPLPIQWIVDVRDSDKGWFIGTAISYVEVLGEAKVKVCVEDRGEDGWEGQVDVNFENIRLMECCDDASKGLFKELVKAMGETARSGASTARAIEAFACVVGGNTRLVANRDLAERSAHHRELALSRVPVVAPAPREYA